MLPYPLCPFFILHPDTSNPLIHQHCEILKNRYGSHSLENSNLFVVLGGDGTLLWALNQYYSFKKPFLGLNFGNHGALLFSTKEAFSLEQYLENARETEIFPLWIQDLENSSDSSLGFPAFNDFYIQRNGPLPLRYRFCLNDQIVFPEACGDGLIISTPLGSSAYNFSAGGPIVSAKIPCIIVQHLNLFLPVGVPPFVISTDAVIKLHLGHQSQEKKTFFILDGLTSLSFQNIRISCNMNHRVICFLPSHPPKSAPMNTFLPGPCLY